MTIPYHPDKWNEVVEGSGLFQGGAQRDCYPRWEGPFHVTVDEEFRAVVTMTDWIPRRDFGPPGWIANHVFPITDDPVMDDVMEDRIEEATRTVVQYLRASKTVLVRCWAGYNRSGVVVARSLMEFGGLSAEDAIDEVRKARGQYALSNLGFVDYLKRKGEQS